MEEKKMTRTEIAIALEQGMVLESDDGTRYISEENMCGGKYAMNYVIGAIILFGAAGILGIVQKFVETALK